MRNCSVHTSVGDRGLRRNVLSGSRVHSALKHALSEAPVLVDLATKSAKTLVVETACDGGVRSLLSAIHFVSYDSPFTALELITLNCGCQACQELVLPCNCLWLPREACFNKER